MRKSFQVSDFKSKPSDGEKALMENYSDKLSQNVLKGEKSKDVEWYETN